MVEYNGGESMDFYRESYFKDITARTSILEQRTFSADSVRAPLETKFDVFLSYNINDIEVVKGIYYYFSTFGLSTASNTSKQDYDRKKASFG